MDKSEQSRHSYQSTPPEPEEILDRMRLDNWILKTRYKEALKSGAGMSELLDIMAEHLEGLGSTFDLEALGPKEDAERR